jgi:predicted transcriptional regulator
MKVIATKYPDFFSLANDVSPEPEEVLRCALGLRRVEGFAYIQLLKLRSADVSSLSKAIGRSRPTTQRICMDLVAKGLATRRAVPMRTGGYGYVYLPVEPSKVAQKVGRMLHELSARMVNSITRLEKGSRATSDQSTLSP